jgi:hypothetical protein
MTAKWKEVSAYTGQDIEEDAPTNFGGQGSGVDMNPTGMKKKKKKSLIDARTKAYKAHKAKLETARVKREQARKSKFIEKVQENFGEFEREAFLVEDNVDVLKNIVKTKGAKTLKFSDGKMKVDLFTAGALVTVMDKVNADNRAKLTKMVNGKKAQFQAAANATFKMLNKAR